jgi:hypothetical protein
MNKQQTVLNDLFKKVNEQKLIKGFIFDREVLQFQSLDGTMVKVKLIVMEETNND